MLRTAAQRKALCKACPIASAADLVGDTQSLLIVRDLLSGPKRFFEITESLGMSTRTITLKLKHLEKTGLVLHAKTGRYALTNKGKGLTQVIRSLKLFGEKYL